MTAAEDRRSPHVRRVSLTTLVDICPTAGETSPFQAQCENISGRGMQVRTGHLPLLGEELVCRFEHEGHEILVEGRVAWRSESDDGGEFGIQFTALDAASADILKGVGRSDRMTETNEQARVHQRDEVLEEGQLELAAGQRVRLHMDGLGAPMKAAVHSDTGRRLRVGSNLEFLKVGRPLELEELEKGDRRSALVDSVNVVINPATSIPELVVQLRYEGVTPAPEPVASQAATSFEEEAAEECEDFVDVPQEGEELGEEDPWEPADALGEKLAALMSSTGQAAAHAGKQLGGVLGAIKLRADEVLKRGKPSGDGRAEGEKRWRSAKRRVQKTRPPTRRAPSHLRSGIHDLGMTGVAQPRRTTARSTSRSTERPRSRRGKSVWLAGALLVSAGALAGLQTLGIAEPFKTEAARAAKNPPEENSKTEQKSQNTPQKGPKQQSPKQPPETSDGIVAEVPLFGTRTLATAEPLAKKSKVDDATAEKLAAAAAVPDQTWEKSKEAKRDEPEPWGRGRLHLPTIHRIRLDAEGTELAGAVEPNGFVVVIPDRKAMESGRAIEKRDKRIVSVTASNTARGAKMRFQFRGPVPPYRVRLRKDFVEFLISAPEEGVAKL